MWPRRDRLGVAGAVGDPIGAGLGRRTGHEAGRGEAEATGESGGFGPRDPAAGPRRDGELAVHCRADRAGEDLVAGTRDRPQGQLVPRVPGDGPHRGRVDVGAGGGDRRAHAGPGRVADQVVPRADRPHGVRAPRGRHVRDRLQDLREQAVVAPQRGRVAEHRVGHGTADPVGVGDQDAADEPGEPALGCRPDEHPVDDGRALRVADQQHRAVGAGRGGRGHEPARVAHAAGHRGTPVPDLALAQHRHGVGRRGVAVAQHGVGLLGPQPNTADGHPATMCLRPGDDATHDGVDGLAVGLPVAVLLGVPVDAHDQHVGAPRARPVRDRRGCLGSGVGPVADRDEERADEEDRHGTDDQSPVPQQPRRRAQHVTGPCGSTRRGRRGEPAPGRAPNDPEPCPRCRSDPASRPRGRG